MNIAEKLNELLKENNVTPYKLAKGIGVSQTTIKNWVTGYTTPKERHIVALAEFFNVTTDELMGKEKQPTDGELSDEEKAMLDLFRQAGDDARRLALLALEHGEQK